MYNCAHMALKSFFGSVKKFFLSVRKAFFIALVFPFYSIRKLFLYSKTAGIPKKILSVLIAVCIALILVPVWLGGYFVITGATVYTVASIFGYSPVLESVAGTGSMYPTFPKGDGKTDKEKAKQIVATANFIRYPGGFTFGEKRFFGHTLERGDIVVFENTATDEITKKQYGEASGYLKRVIALPGDTLELRGGLVFLNGEALKEPYTAKARSTFAESYLSECKKITIPSHKVFTMGDNRKGSGDSRGMDERGHRRL